MPKSLYISLIQKYADEETIVKRKLLTCTYHTLLPLLLRMWKSRRKSYFLFPSQKRTNTSPMSAKRAWLNFCSLKNACHRIHIKGQTATNMLWSPCHWMFIVYGLWKSSSGCYERFGICNQPWVGWLVIKV